MQRQSTLSVLASETAQTTGKKGTATVWKTIAEKFHDESRAAIKQPFGMEAAG